MALLEMRDIDKSFPKGRGSVAALSGFSLDVDAGECVGLIGESGSGKSTAGRIAAGLIRPDSGAVTFMGWRIYDLPRREVKQFRPHLQMVFQEPYESLNPRMTIGSIVGEPLVLHQPQLSKAGRRERVVSTLALVGLDASVVPRYPRELSGGQQQRVGIARAAVTKPRLIVLDEPTSSLDLSVRAITLALLRELQEQLDLAYLFISHDISTVGYFCSRVVVLNQGRIVEDGRTEQVLTSPREQYTRDLLSASLSPDPEQRDRPAVQ